MSNQTYCSKCGTKQPAINKFCGNCSASLTTSIADLLKNEVKTTKTKKYEPEVEFEYEEEQELDMEALGAVEIDVVNYKNREHSAKLDVNKGQVSLKGGGLPSSGPREATKRKGKLNKKKFLEDLQREAQSTRNIAE